jgi:hypothetical protein
MWETLYVRFDLSLVYNYYLMIRSVDRLFSFLQRGGIRNQIVTWYGNSFERCIFKMK